MHDYPGLARGSYPNNRIVLNKLLVEPLDISVLLRRWTID